MTLIENRAADLRPHLLIDELIARHGGWTVARALLRGLLTARRRRRDALHLSDHLRRDVGLPPGHPPPGMRDLHL
ncbi:hypothetical protein [Aliiroseovarius subalbicans]|uniref:hypothetical protein n=1 Tax=Aliiroseovarius subalbicans TaxID=2925840 RepID=UPI001F595024|nr:hypothetical protein [Aliiroseovarius subalbicans]